MAIAGKVFPQANRQDHIDTNTYTNFSIPPHRWWMKVGVDPVGTLMAKWVGYEGLSELVFQDGLQLHWKFLHPTITVDDPHWLIAWRLEWNGLTTAAARYVVKLRWSYHEAGVELGWYDPFASGWFATLSTGGTEVFVDTNWNVTSPALFSNGGTTTFQSLKRSTWAQEPDFHPYRTRP